MNIGKALLATAVAIGTATSAHAAVFDAGTLAFQYYAYGGTYGSTVDFATPSGSYNFGGYFTVSAAGNQITYTYTSPTTWSPSTTSLNSGGLYIDNGALLSSVSGIPAFTSVTIDPSSQLGSSGFGAGNLTFNSGNIAVSWMNLSFATGNTVILDVDGAPAVPEPASWALMLTGFGLVGFAMRRRADPRTTVSCS